LRAGKVSRGKPGNVGRDQLELAARGVNQGIQPAHDRVPVQDLSAFKLGPKQPRQAVGDAAPFGMVHKVTAQVLLQVQAHAAQWARRRAVLGPGSVVVGVAQRLADADHIACIRKVLADRDSDQDRMQVRAKGGIHETSPSEGARLSQAWLGLYGGIGGLVGK
jgi:hypothetical protein